MQTKDLLLLLAGGFISLVIVWAYDASPLKTHAARRSAASAAKRKAQLEKRRAVIDKYHDDRQALSAFLLGRLSLAVAIFLGQGVLSTFLHLYSTSSHGIAVLTTEPIFIESSEEMRKYIEEHTFETQVNIAIDAATSLLFFVLSFLSFFIVFRAFRIWRQVQKYEEFRSSNDKQQASLTEGSHVAPWPEDQ